MDIDIRILVYHIHKYIANRKSNSGHHATYRGRRHEYYEAWFDVDDTTALSLVVETRGDILEIDTVTLVAEVDPKCEIE